MPVEKWIINEEGVEKDLSKSDVVDLLRKCNVTVTFTKADGTERVMECTVLEEVLVDRFKINEDKPEESNFGAVPESNNIAVWDIEKDGWRSFRMDSVKSIGFPTQSQ